jgi:hypothetical protein
LEDAKNIYHKYHLRTVDSLLDKQCEDLTRVPLEFVLPEQRGVVHTFKCYRKIKSLMTQVNFEFNKSHKKMNNMLYAGISANSIFYNEKGASYTADQLRLIASSCTSEQLDVVTAQKCAVLLDRVLPNLTKLVSIKHKNQINGVYLLTLLH